jgi:hypothetical protein
MAFGFAGAAAGGSKALEDIVAQRMLAQKLEAEIANRQKQTELEQAALNQRSVEHSDNMRSRQRDDDRLDADRRDRNNSQGVRKMVGESLMQGGEPDRRALAAMQIEAGDAPTMLNEPPKRLRQVTTRGPKGEPINRMAGEDEAVEEWQAPKAPTRHERDPIADREAILKLEQRYRTNNNAADPAAEAQDTAREAKRIASELLGHQGLDGAFGVINAKLPTLRQDTADAEVLRDALTSLLTLENTGKLKGVLSNADMAILRQASTTISGAQSPAAARSELKRLVEVMGRAAGEGGLPQMDRATSRGAAPAPSAAPSNDARVAVLIKKYGG